MSKEADKKVTSTMMLFAGGLLVMMVILILLANSLMRSADKAAVKDTSAEKAAISRIKPVGQVNVGSAGPAKARSGKDVVEATCKACHGTGVMGAPKIGNTADWAPRVKQGLKTLLQHALNGKGNMPPQKGAVSEKDLTAAIKYMSGIK